MDWLIRKYFPFGCEQCGVGEKAYSSLKTNDALSTGLERTDVKRLLDLPGEADCYSACRKGIRRCQMNLNTAIWNTGFVDLVKMMNDMKKPPYGWKDDPHAVYCFGGAQETT